MLGDAPYADELRGKLRRLAGDRVLMPGAIYGEGYRELLFNCRLYIHATEVGGTHPALVEAMGAGRPLLVLDTPENREVAGDAASFFRFEKRGFPDALGLLLENESELARSGTEAAARAGLRYTWDAVSRSYEEVLEGLC